METLRCLIAEIPQKVLADIVQTVTQKNQNIEVVGQLPDLADVPNVIAEQAIDVLILGMKKYTSHDFCYRLVKKFPNLLIVGLIDDGRATAIFIGDVGSSQLVRIINLHSLAREQ